MPEPLKTIARIIGWTLLQAVVVVLCFEIGKAAVSAVHDWRPNIGRGILWLYYLGGFVGLALVANIVLETWHVGNQLWKRLAVWCVVLVLLVVYTLPSWSSLPLAVPFIHACAVVAMAVREFAAHLTLVHRQVASG